MSTKPVPQALPIRQALDQSAPLAKLVQRLRESQGRHVAIEPVLPPALRRSVRAGPVDEEGWTLLAANAAVAAKLRHLLPLLAQRLADEGWAALPIRVKVQAHGT
jgi:hypothetical protein